MGYIFWGHKFRFCKGGNKVNCFPYYLGNEKLEGFECNAIIAIKEKVKNFMGMADQI